MGAIRATVEGWFSTGTVTEQAAGLVILFLASVLVFYSVRRVFLGAIGSFARRTAVTWDDALHRHRVFDRLAHLPPAIVLTYGVQLIPNLNETVELLVQRVALSIIFVVTARSIGAFLSAIDEIYSSDPDIRGRSIKGYLQVIEIVVYIVTAILVVATLVDRSPLIFLSGIGAMTAVLLLIFRDTLLGLVASVQISTNDMLRVGDWVEMPDFGADGDVIEIALHTVKVQNWDKTITTVPTSKLIEGSFKNWRGMSTSGGRRIKRALFLDVHSVRFLEDDELDRFERYSLLQEYIARKRRELAEFNTQPGRSREINADIRRLTNVGTFRAYLFAYLRHHPDIHQGMTLLVRQLAATRAGIPIEVYCFVNNTEWGYYEGVMADIFDHVFAILPDFGLRAFQDVSDLGLAERRSGG